MVVSKREKGINYRKLWFKESLLVIENERKKKGKGMENKSLMGYLKGLSAPRKEKGKRHEQEEILVIIKMGLMMGCKRMRERGGATPRVVLH